ncbi:hypothetical protein MC885_008282 [Smutsia gigantea]|nr:hypothetical protein MC885_008282 [Smutsia gigantea]
MRKIGQCCNSKNTAHLSGLGIPGFQGAPQHLASRTAGDPRLGPKDWGSAPPERANAHLDPELEDADAG